MMRDYLYVKIVKQVVCVLKLQLQILPQSLAHLATGAIKFKKPMLDMLSSHVHQDIKLQV